MTNTIQISFKERLFYFFPVLYCFCLPFGTLALSGIIILWGITSFFNIQKQYFVNGIKNRNLHLLYLFFFITVISAFFSDNGQEALFNVENKLSFFFLPYYFFCFRWPVNVIKTCLVSFVSGCFFAALFLIGRGAVHAFNGHPEYFFYTLFSYFIHASYFAMYLMMTISIIVLYYPIWFAGKTQVKIFSVIFLLIFVITIFLCSSKLGIISFFIVCPLLVFYKYRYLFNWKKTILLTAGLLVALLIFSKVFSAPFERLKSITNISLQNIDKTSSESTTVRILIWDQCVSLIKDNFLFGVGVGDVIDELVYSYEKSGMTGALEHRLNAHNQYLQTFIGMGVIGLISLLLITIGVLIKAVLQRHFILAILMLLIVINFLVESMLQRSDGTLFYVFFLCLLSLPQSKNELKQ